LSSPEKSETGGKTTERKAIQGSENQEQEVKGQEKKKKDLI
jgi:hypothetical protein